MTRRLWCALPAPERRMDTPSLAPCEPRWGLQPCIARGRECLTTHVLSPRGRIQLTAPVPPLIGAPSRIGHSSSRPRCDLAGSDGDAARNRRTLDRKVRPNRHRCRHGTNLPLLESRFAKREDDHEQAYGPEASDKV